MNYIVIGYAGTGKSFIAKELLKEKLFTTEIIDGLILYDELENEKKISFPEDRVYKYKTCEVLIIDEFPLIFQMNLHLNDIIDILEYRYNYHKKNVLIMQNDNQLYRYSIPIVENILKHAYWFDLNKKMSKNKKMSEFISIIQTPCLAYDIFHEDKDYANLYKIELYPKGWNRYPDNVIVLNKDEFYPIYENNFSPLKESKYYIDNRNNRIHFLVHLSMQELDKIIRNNTLIKRIFGKKNKIEKKILDYTESWKKNSLNEIEIEFIGFINDYKNYK